MYVKENASPVKVMDGNIYNTVGCPSGHKGVDLKSTVSARIRPERSNRSPIAMVAVAQLVEHQIVTLGVASSTLVGYPIYPSNSANSSNRLLSGKS